jgi:diguanylate cyclase (GGDEF)-like protein
MAAAFFMLSALLGPLARFSRGDAAAGPLNAEWGALSFGLLAVLLPWDRWPQGRLHVVAAAGFALKVVTTLEIGASPWLYALHYLMLFMWIGAALGQRTPLLWGLPAAAAYVAPILWMGGDRAAAASAILVIPASVFTGEAAAWLTARLRRAERTSMTRAETMAGLVDATLALAACEDCEELARLTAQSAAEIYRADCALVLLDDGEQRLTPAGAIGWKEHSLAALEDPRVAEQLRAAMARDDALTSADAGELARAFGLGGLRVVPLRGSGAVLGAALVGSFASPAAAPLFTEYVARTLATQAGLGFERARSAEALRHESLRDPLTEVGNRRSAEAALERLKDGDAVAVIDFDHFKDVNDTYGHAAGDRALRALADHLRCGVRELDSVYRIGGDEFLVVLPGAGRAGLAVVHRLHERWRAQERVTSFSAGLAIMAPGEAPHAALARADGALYHAKHEGRDRVALDASPDDES